MVTHYFESHLSGMIAGHLVRQLLNLGEEVVWLSSNATPAPSYRKDGFRGVAVNALNVTEGYLGIPFPIPSLPGMFQIRREVRRADVVLLQDSLYPACMLAFRFARYSGIPVVIAARVGIIPYNNPVFRALMRLANRIVVRPMLAGADRIAF